MGPTGTVEFSPFHVYVQPGAVGGDGTQARPFGTIQAGVDAVLPGGIVYLLAGVYSLADTVMLDKPNVTLKGAANALVVLQAPVVAFLVTGGGDVLDGLIITSDNPYAVEFIQFAGAGNQLLNTTVFGPAQSGSSTDWVVNRGFVTQGNVTELLVRGCMFFSLRQSAYLNPNSTGSILHNTVYNTRGFVVDSAVFLFSGNAWGLPANATDIALLAGTVTGAPYDPLTDLSASNSAANISDQR